MRKRRANSHIKTKELDFLKSNLLNEKARIERSLRSDAQYNCQDTERKDTVDEANENILVYQNARFANRESLYLKKINKTLRKIDEDNYGLCDECGGPIPFTRLRARLTSDLCIECKEEAEGFEANSILGKRSKSLGYTISFAGK